MNIRHLLSMTALTVIALLLAACSGGGGTQAEFTLSTGDDFKFSPSTWTVKAGQPVTFTFRNTGSVEHGFAILKAGADLEHMLEEAHAEAAMHEELMFEMHELAGGASATGTFTAPAEPGDYTFACLVPGHAEAGEVGALIVIP